MALPYTLATAAVGNPNIPHRPLQTGQIEHPLPTDPAPILHLANTTTNAPQPMRAQPHIGDLANIPQTTLNPHAASSHTHPIHTQPILTQPVLSPTARAPTQVLPSKRSIHESIQDSQMALMPVDNLAVPATVHDFQHHNATGPIHPNPPPTQRIRPNPQTEHANNLQNPAPRACPAGFSTGPIHIGPGGQQIYQNAIQMHQPPLKQVPMHPPPPLKQLPMHPPALLPKPTVHLELQQQADFAQRNGQDSAFSSAAAQRNTQDSAFRPRFVPPVRGPPNATSGFQQVSASKPVPARFGMDQSGGISAVAPAAAAPPVPPGGPGGTGPSYEIQEPELLHAGLSIAPPPAVSEGVRAVQVQVLVSNLPWRRSPNFNDVVPMLQYPTAGTLLDGTLMQCDVQYLVKQVDAATEPHLTGSVLFLPLYDLQGNVLASVVRTPDGPTQASNHPPRDIQSPRTQNISSPSPSGTGSHHLAVNPQGALQELEATRAMLQQSQAQVAALQVQVQRPAYTVYYAPPPQTCAYPSEQFVGSMPAKLGNLDQTQMTTREVKQCQEAKQLLVGLSEQEVELLWHQLPKDQLPPHMQDLARLKEAVRDLNEQQLQKKKEAEEGKTAADVLMQPPN